MRRQSVFTRLSLTVCITMFLVVLTPISSVSATPDSEPAPVPSEVSTPDVAPAPLPTPTPVVVGVGGVSVAKQFRFLGYTVSNSAINGKGASRSDKSEVTRFQLKFGVKQSGRVTASTLRALDTYAGMARVPKRCVTGIFTLCVNKFSRTLQAVSSNGNVLRVLDARFGMPGMETDEGRFTVLRKFGAVHISSLYQVNMPYSVFFSGAQAVHFSQQFYDYPSTQSHGCVGTRNMTDQRWINKYSQVGVTPVVVFNSRPVGSRSGSSP